MSGIQTVDIDQTVRLAVAGLEMGTFSDEKGDDYAVFVTTPKKERPTLESFQNVFVNTPMGSAVPLAQIASLRLEAAPLRIDHYNKIRTVSISAFVDKGYLNDQVI